jgi:hypothetical protein
VSRPRTTAGKRNVQQHKREKAKAKQERRAARRVEDPEMDATRVEATEAELIDELAAIHRAVEMATMSPEEFENRREHIRLQLEQIERCQPMTSGEAPGVCNVCGRVSSLTVEPPRRTLARGADNDDPSLSVIIVLPDVVLCEDHADEVGGGQLSLGWSDNEQCRTYGEAGLVSPCGEPFRKLKR